MTQEFDSTKKILAKTQQVQKYKKKYTFESLGRAMGKFCKRKW